MRVVVDAVVLHGVNAVLCTLMQSGWHACRAVLQTGPLAHLEQEVLGSARLMRLDVAQCELAARLRLHVKGSDALCGPRVAGTLQQSTFHPSCREQDRTAGLVCCAAGLRQRVSKECAGALCCQQLLDGPQAGQISSAELRSTAGACSAMGQCAPWCAHATGSGLTTPFQQCKK